MPPITRASSTAQTKYSVIDRLPVGEDAAAGLVSAFGRRVVVGSPCTGVNVCGGLLNVAVIAAGVLATAAVTVVATWWCVTVGAVVTAVGVGIGVGVGVAERDGFGECDGR